MNANNNIIVLGALQDFFSLQFQTQFILVVIHSSQLLFMDCNYPQVFVYWIGLYAVIFLGMFANFYIQAYRTPKKSHGNGTLAHAAKNGSATDKKHS